MEYGLKNDVEQSLIELKPCPFCGDADILPFIDYSGDQGKEPYWKCGCDSCRIYHCATSEGLATSSWNTRQHKPEPVSLEKCLDAAIQCHSHMKDFKFSEIAEHVKPRVLRETKAVLEAAGVPMSNEWQPIDTAPKSTGLRHILLCDSVSGRVQSGKWPLWSDKAAWTTMDGVVHEPTHWMPLPEAPHD